MNRRSLAVLIVLNVALLLALVLVPGGQNEANAQLRRTNAYMMVAGDIVGRQEQVVYITELNTSRTIGVIYNSARKQFALMGAWDIAKDVETVTGGGSRGGAGVRP